MDKLGYDEYHLQTLIKLGLTPNQGKLYLSLFQTGKASGGTLSKETKLARQEVYRILSELQEKGLVEKIFSTPLEFQGVTIQDGISILMNQKAIEFQETEKRIQSLLTEYSAAKQRTLSETEYKFFLIPPKKTLKETREKMLESAKESIKLITTSKRFSQGIVHFSETYKKALQRNVNTQIIVEEPEKTETVIKSIKVLGQYPNCKIRFIPTSKANLLIIDKNEAIVTLFPERDLGASPVLWTNHPGFLDICQGYFDSLWSTEKTRSNTIT